MIFETEQEAIEWVQNNIPLLIKPKKKGKYSVTRVFASTHAFEQVIEALGKSLFRLTQKHEP